MLLNKMKIKVLMSIHRMDKYLMYLLLKLSNIRRKGQLLIFSHQMELTSGTVSVSGRVAYVPQQSWLMGDTIQANILLNTQFDQVR